MNNFFVIPKSNTLRFVRTDANILPSGYLSDKPTRDNRLFQDQVYQPGATLHPYWQKFNTGDPILTQFTSDYPNISVKLYNELGNSFDYTNLINTIFTYQDGSNAKIYDILIDTTNLGGNYYIKISAAGLGRPSLEFTSEWIQIDDFSDLAYIIWSQSVRDGIMYTNNEQFGFRVDALLADITSEVDKNVFMGFDFELINEKSIPKKIMNFATDPIPWYIAEKLTLAFDHEQVTINDEYYQAPDKPTSTFKTWTNLYEFNCKLQQVFYENYKELIPLPGTPVISGDFISFDGTDAMMVDLTNVLLVHDGDVTSIPGGARITDLANELTQLPSGYSVLIDKSTDPTESQIPLPAIIPCKLQLIPIGNWNLRDSNNDGQGWNFKDIVLSDLGINPNDILALKVWSIIDDDGLIHNSESLMDDYFLDNLQQAAHFQGIQEATDVKTLYYGAYSHYHLIDNYGKNWTQVGSSRIWKAIKINDSGFTQVAVVYNGYMYKSTGSGVTWSQIASIQNWVDLVMTSSANRIIGLSDNNGVWLSVDYGSTFTNPTITSITGTWKTLNMTSNGRVNAVLFDGTNSYYYTSTNYGDTWTNTWVTVGEVIMHAVSGTGLEQIEVVEFSDRYEIHRSTNYESFALTGGGSHPAFIIYKSGSNGSLPLIDSLTSLTMDSTGAICFISYVTGTDGGILRSQNHGVNWGVVKTGIPVRKVTVCANSFNLLAITDNNFGFISTDMGNNWTQILTSQNWSGCSINADASVQAVCSANGYVYLSFDSYADIKMSESNQGKNIAIMAFLNKSLGKIILKHNYPGGDYFLMNNSDSAPNGNMNASDITVNRMQKFTNTSRNRGYILLFKQFD